MHFIILLNLMIISELLPLIDAESTLDELPRSKGNRRITLYKNYSLKRSGGVEESFWHLYGQQNGTKSNKLRVNYKQKTNSNKLMFQQRQRKDQENLEKFVNYSKHEDREEFVMWYKENRKIQDFEKNSKDLLENIKGNVKVKLKDVNQYEGPQINNSFIGGFLTKFNENGLGKENGNGNGFEFEFVAKEMGNGNGKTIHEIKANMNAESNSEFNRDVGRDMDLLKTIEDFENFENFVKEKEYMDLLEIIQLNQYHYHEKHQPQRQKQQSEIELEKDDMNRNVRPLGQLTRIFGSEQLTQIRRYYNLLKYDAEHQTHFHLYTGLKSFATRKRKHHRQDHYQQEYQAKSMNGKNETAHHRRNESLAKPLGSFLKECGQHMDVNDTNGRFLNLIGAAFGMHKENNNFQMAIGGNKGIRIEQIQLNNVASLKQSRFDATKPTRLLIHGWLGGQYANVYQALIPAYLKQGNGEYNIIAVDWGRGSLAGYVTASYRVKRVGKVVAKFIDFLKQEGGLSFKNFHVIGFSMGAHIAGIAGKHVHSGRLPAIFALDPALPLFFYDHTEERIAITDADHVEVIHSSAGSYGYDKPLGHVDFYLNYGNNQPGCFLRECSHFRAYNVFAESLNGRNLIGHECMVNYWQDMIKRHRCLMKSGKRLAMNADSLKNVELRKRKGIYYVFTNNKPPFAKKYTEVK